MRYKIIYEVKEGIDQEPEIEQLKSIIANDLSSLLMNRMSIRRQKEPGRVVFEARITVLHEDQIQSIRTMMNILSKIPIWDSFAKELSREIFDM